MTNRTFNGNESKRSSGNRAIALSYVAVEAGFVVSAIVLHSFGVTVDAVQQEVEKYTGFGTDQVDKNDVPFTPRAKRAMELAALEADKGGKENTFFLVFASKR